MSSSGAVLTYYFRAGAPDGGVFSGQIDAESVNAVLMQLRQKGFQPLRVETRPIRSSWLTREISFGGGKQLRRTDCESFCRELSLLLSSGMMVMDAISIMLPSLTKGSRIAKFASSVRHGLRLGRSLSAAAESSGYEASADFLPVIRAGEEAGELSKALTMLAESYADANRFSRAYSSALAYPALLFVVSILVFGLIAFFVAPNLAGLFISMERPVPFAIAVLAGASNFLSSNVVGLGIGTVLLLLAVGAGVSAADRYLRGVLFRVPVIGSAMRWSASRRFAATLRLYISSSVPIATALPNAFASAGFPGGTASARGLAERVRAGAKLSASLEAAKLLPPKLVQMIAVGETGGRLVEVLGAIVTESKNRFEQRMALVSTLLAPLLILLVGGLIGTVIFSVFSALLDINNVVL